MLSGRRLEGTCNRAAVDGGEGDGMRQGTGVHTIGLQVGNENRHPYGHWGSNQRSISMYNIKID